MAGYISDDTRKVTTHRLVEMKQRGEKISMLTSYDYTMAQIVDGAGVESDAIVRAAVEAVIDRNPGHEHTEPIPPPPDGLLETSRLAWETGRAMADSLIERHLNDTGEYPRSVGLSVWGTSAMRTSGDDIAEVLALIGESGEMLSSS